MGLLAERPSHCQVHDTFFLLFISIYNKFCVYFNILSQQRKLENDCYENDRSSSFLCGKYDNLAMHGVYQEVKNSILFRL
jgi:hypothetical protein